MKLEIISIANGGDLERELVDFRVVENCNLKFFKVCETSTLPGGRVSTRLRQSFWFPPREVLAGDYVRLLTKKGFPDAHRNAAGTTTHVFYWELDKPVWKTALDLAMLMEIAGWQAKAATFQRPSVRPQLVRRLPGL